MEERSVLLLHHLHRRWSVPLVRQTHSPEIATDDSAIPRSRWDLDRSDRIFNNTSHSSVSIVSFSGFAFQFVLLFQFDINWIQIVLKDLLLQKKWEFFFKYLPVRNIKSNSMSVHLWCDFWWPIGYRGWILYIQISPRVWFIANRLISLAPTSDPGVCMLVGFCSHYSSAWTADTVCLCFCGCRAEIGQISFADRIWVKGFPFAVDSTLLYPVQNSHDIHTCVKGRDWGERELRQQFRFTRVDFELGGSGASVCNMLEY